MEMSLRNLKQAALNGNAERTARQHAANKNTARERIEALYDSGSFVETDTLYLDSHVICGFGTVNGRPVYCFSQDFTSSGAAMTLAQSHKICKLLDAAAMNGAPVVMMLDSAGVKVDEGIKGIKAYSDIFRKLSRLSGVCPIVAIVLGECRGSSVILPQLSDFVIQGPKGIIGLHGLQVMNGDKQETAFGAGIMSEQGVCSCSADSEIEAIKKAVAFLEYLPSCNAEDSPIRDGEDMNRLLKTCSSDDVNALIADLADDETVFGISSAYGKALQCALIRMGGRSVGLIASNPKEDEGRLDEASCQKAARFIRLCDCYQIPVLTMVDSTGVSVPEISAQGRLMRALAGLEYAYAEATTAKMAVIIGQAVGPALAVLACQSDYSIAWENAMIAPMTCEVGTAVLQDAALQNGENRKELEKEYAAGMNAVNAAQAGLIDEAIEAADTRKYLIAALEMLVSKRDVNLPRKHGNQP